MRRLYYLDNLRIFLSILVVLHHVGIGYGSMGGWCYVTSETVPESLQIILSALFAIEATFSMSLFFFISAYLTASTIDKKGAGKFIKTQLLRLGIPLLFVMIIFAPSILYFIELYRHTTQLSFFEYVLQQNINSPNTSHTWFILVLIFFEVIYVLYWKYLRHRFSVSAYIRNNIPAHKQIAIFIFVCTIITILLRLVYPIGENFIGLQIANFVPYCFMYAMGLLVSRKNWLDLLSEKITKTWFIVSIPATIIFCYIVYIVIKYPPSINNFINGFHPESVSLAFLETIICIGFCGFLIQLFKRYFDFSNTFLQKLAANRYGVYIFHSGIVVGITILLEFITFQPTVKFIINSVLSVVVSFVFVGLIRNFQFIKKFI